MFKWFYLDDLCNLSHIIISLYNIVYKHNIQTMACKYKNLFGPLKTGIHSYRIYDIAVLDILVTMIVAYIISYFSKYPYLYTLVIFFIVGTICFINGFRLSSLVFSA